MKRIKLLLWNILTILMLLILFLGVAYFKFLSNRLALISFVVVLLLFILVPQFLKKQNRKQILLIENLSINVIFLFILGILIIKSPGKPKHFNDKTSISKWEKVKIGGIDQWLLIKGQNKDNPVILYLTGGYGHPSFHVIANKYPQLEKDFIVVYWEQRGTGKSFNENIPDSSFTLEHLASDVNNIAKYLKQKYNKEKLILVGHSWGTQIGVVAYKKYPDNFYFMTSVGQVVDFEMNFEIKYQEIYQKAEKENNKKIIKQLIEIGKPPYHKQEKWEINNRLNSFADYYSKSDYSKNWQKRESFMLLFLCPEYTLSEKIRIKAFNKLITNIVDESFNTNFYNSAYEFSKPIFFVQGKNDLNTTTSLVEKYFNKIVAPEKDILIINQTGHDVHFDKPKEFHQFLMKKAKMIEN